MKPQTLKIVNSIVRKSKKYRDFRDSISEIAKGFNGQARYDFMREAFAIFERALRNRRLAKSKPRPEKLKTHDLCRMIDNARIARARKEIVGGVYRPSI